MSSPPKVSIVMAAFNCAQFIEQAIDSVLAQTAPDFELIIVDDGSRDDTLSVARLRAERDQRIRVFAQAPSGRPGVTRNTGLDHAKGTFVGFLDADDWYEPTRIARCLEAFAREPDADVVFHDMLYTDADGNPLPGSYLLDTNFLTRSRDSMQDLGGGLFRCGNGYYEFMSTNYAGMHTNTVMLRRRLMNEAHLRFPIDVAIGEDTDLWFRLGRNGKIAYLNEKLCYYRQLGTSITRNQERWFRDLLIVHERNFRQGKVLLNQKARRRYCLRISEMFLSQGFMYWNQGRYAEARRAYRRSFAWSPRVKTFKSFLKALVPDTLAQQLSKRRDHAAHS